MDKPQEVANTAAGHDQTEDFGGMTEQQMVSDFLCSFISCQVQKIKLLFLLIDLRSRRAGKLKTPLHLQVPD